MVSGSDPDQAASERLSSGPNRTFNGTLADLTNVESPTNTDDIGAWDNASSDTYVIELDTGDEAARAAIATVSQIVKDSGQPYDPFPGDEDLYPDSCNSNCVTGAVVSRLGRRINWGTVRVPGWFFSYRIRRSVGGGEAGNGVFYPAGGGAPQPVQPPPDPLAEHEVHAFVFGLLHQGADPTIVIDHPAQAPQVRERGADHAGYGGHGFQDDRAVAILLGRCRRRSAGVW
jgi:hypothetical protein